MLLGAASPLDSIMLPNASTWTCMVLVLLVMLFVRFAKPFQWRHIDLLLLFLLTVPILFLRESQEIRDDIFREWCAPDQRFVAAMGIAAQICAAPLQAAQPIHLAHYWADQVQRSHPDWLRSYGFEQRSIWLSYLWLMIFSLLLLLRSFLDLFREHKNEFRSNATTGAMFWLGLVLITIFTLKSFASNDWKGAPRPRNDSKAVEEVTHLLNALPIEPTETNKYAAVACHTLLVAHLILIGWLHFRQVNMGVSAALLYLLMPYTAVLFMNLSQVMVSLFVVMAITWYRLPAVAGLLMGIGAGLGLYPIFLMPAWVGFYFKRGHRRFLISFLCVFVGFAAFWVWSTGWAKAWEYIWSLADWQFWATDKNKILADGLWNTIALNRAYRIPLFIIFAALIITSGLWPHRKNLGQLITWSVVLTLGVQFWYADAGGSYILWYLPLIALQMVRPSLTHLEAVQIVPEQDRLRQTLRWLMSWRKPTENVEKRQPPTALAG